MLLVANCAYYAFNAQFKTAMTPIDTLLSARWVIPVHSDVVLDHHSVAIDQGKIIDLLPTSDALHRYHPADHQQLIHHALVPGLINAHTHSPMTLLRGYADDLTLMTWLNEHIWPAERSFVNADFCRDGTLLAAAEMIRGGTTCCNDMYFFPEQSAAIFHQVGLRATLGLIVFDFPSPWGSGPDEYFDKGLQLHDTLKGDQLLRVAFAPHAPYSVADDPLARVGMLAAELDLPIHMHVHETQDEIRGSLQQYGKRPLARLHEMGLLSPQLIAVHMTQLEPDEIELVAETGAHIVHCPESNLKLASGFCPVHRLVDAGVTVAIGTDGPASNNDLDMLGELRIAALLAKAVADKSHAFPAMAALRAATLHGAQALGLAHEIGSLEINKSADMIAINLQHPATQPVFDPVSQIVYAAGRDQITDVWVAGKQLLCNREFTTIDDEEVRNKAHHWHRIVTNG